MELEEALAEIETLKGKIKSVNDEAKGHRLSAEAFSKQLDDFRNKWQSATAEIDTIRKGHGEELDKIKIDHSAQLKALETERDGAKSAALARIVDAELKVAAREAGMVDLDGLKLLDRSAVKVDDDGNVANAAELLTAMKEAKPYLFGAVPAPGTTTGTTTSTSRTPASNPGNTSFDARAASKEEYEKAKREALAKATKR